MEAVPKLPMMNFELKPSPENTHFGPKLKQYIADAYREDPESYSNEMHQLESLRSAAVRPSMDAAGLSAMYRYFCQLRAIQSRFPMAKGQPAACNFVWKDIYAGMNCSGADIRYEMACILHNIGALHSHLGASEPRTSPESLKAACTHFQNAAWAFQLLREQYPQPASGVDICSEILTLLQEICFAQAQECILEKSIQDTRKPSVVGAVATQVMFFYKNSLAHLGPSAGTDNIHEIVGTKLYNYWHRNLSFKKLYIGCIVCLYQGMHAEEQQKMGERVAFYQLAVEKLAEARKLAKYVEPASVTMEALTFTNDVVEGKRKAAKNENEFIYHEEVPDKDMLVDMKPVCLVKALSVNLNDPEISGPDIFARLIPIGAHEAASVYSEEKAKLLRQVISQVDAKNTELSEFMSSLQLDQLEVLDSDQKVPQEIVDRCAAMNAKTEIIQTLSDSMNSLAEIISDVENSLAEIKALIQEETQNEKDFQKVMGPRPPSIVQTELSREYHKYQEAHARTHESNQVLHKAMTLHIANLRLLAQPLDALQSRIPSLDDIEGLDRGAMSEMKQIVGKAHEMQAQRDSLVSSLRAAVAADDVTGRLLARAAEPRDQLFAAELAKHDTQVKIIRINLGLQETVINKLTSLYASYGESRRMLSELLRKREGMINALITSYDSHSELLAKCQKGLEFYRKLSHSVGQLLARLRSTCQVQREERDTQLAQHAKAATATPAPARVDTEAPREGLKLKDYLPYMKKRVLPRTPSQQQVEAVPPDNYYPESIYPTSVRPAPLGSEADTSQMQLPDGVVMPHVSNMSNPNVPNPYRYGSPYSQNEESYPSNYYTKGYEKPEENPYGYSPYTPSQYSHQVTNPQAYANPYYSGSQDSTTAVTDSQCATAYNAPNSQANTPNMSHSVPTASGASIPTQQDQYYAYGHSQITPIPEAASVSNYSAQTDLSANFAQMQVTPKEAYQPNYPDYSQTYYSVNYPQAATPNMATYSNAEQNSHTSTVPSATLDNTSANHPYSAASNASQYQQPTVSNAYTPEQFNYTAGYDASQGYTIYTNADTGTYSSTSVTTAPQSDSYAEQMPQLEIFDQPIKSHVTGEALNYRYQSYDPQAYASTPTNPPEAPPASFYQNQPNVNYVQTFQNHPGYNYNPVTGSFDYSYGSQNSYASYVSQPNVQPNDDKFNPQTVYTSAGACDTVQSPSETPQVPQPSDNQTYYNTPYGYITNTSQSNQVVPNSEVTTNYGADVNQSTYMQSGHPEYNTVTYSNNQVTTPKEEIQQPTFEIKAEPVQSPQETIPDEPQPVVTETPEADPEPSVFDLLSAIDFTVEQKPLVPDIKVPQISESAIKKPIQLPKEEPMTPVPKKEVIYRPEKRDLFSDPILLNSFTQEVKNLQLLVDGLMRNTPSGLTLLDSKWKMLQDVQSKESTRSKDIGLKHHDGNPVTAIVPYDDSRLIVKSDPGAYINASYYKQLTPWCIPLVISSIPEEKDNGVFWMAVLENEVTCVVCLQTEIELQGKSHWPTAIGKPMELPGGTKVLLKEVICSVNWTERKLTVTRGKTSLDVNHYQITVFPAKIACSPLVMLADRILADAWRELRAAWLQCAGGGARCGLLAALVALVCQARAGQPALADTLDTACVNLYRHRTNVLENTKYLADTYRTVLFYAQGVLCWGTTSFPGEASAPAPAPPRPLPAPADAAQGSAQRSKFSRESFEEMKQAPGLTSGDMKDPLNFLDPLWSLKKK